MLRAEFHCHTIYSKDSLVSPEALLGACRRKGIERVVITDHNTIAGAVHATAIDPSRAIIGEEIMTRNGELLAFFVKEELPPRLEPMEAISRLREQGAFISVSHPFDVMRNGHWEIDALLEILPWVDAIETFNARCMQAEYNDQAQQFARQHNLTGTVGSDAHATFELGRAAMLLPEFHDADSLRLALKQAKTQTSLSSPFVHFTSRYAVWKKMFYKKIGKPLQPIPPGT